METDYKVLCQQLFGTTDVQELTQIAEKLTAENPRNAGRKCKFGEQDVARIQEMLSAGKTINEIAETFHTSRQIISKYLNEKPEPGCTMRMTLMYQTSPCTVIDVNFLEKKIRIHNRTNDLLHRAFGVNEQPGWEDFEYFLQDRCFPASRGNVKALLKAMELPGYDPLAIVEKTHGRMAEDKLWLRFQYYDRNGGTLHAGS